MKIMKELQLAHAYQKDKDKGSSLSTYIENCLY